jgi:hypothetical protein
MEPSTAVDAFVPLWIFAPMLLIGIVGWIATPNLGTSRQDRPRSTGGDPGLGLGMPDSRLARR